MVKNSIDGRIRIHYRLNGLKELERKSPEAFRKAMKKGAIQFLNWANNGSRNEPTKPPIRWGVLRGSSTAFVGNELVEVYPQQVKAGSGETISPLKNYSGDPKVMTWIWNVDYATKMHETKWSPGPFSRQDGNTGNKWVEKHLKSDRESLMKMIGMEFKKETGI